MSVRVSSSFFLMALCGGMVAFLPAHSVYAAIPPLTAEGMPMPTLSPILKPIMPGIVNISVKSKVKVQVPDMFNDPMFRRFFGEQFGLPPDGKMPEREVQGAGSGVIVDAQKGYVITNNHVIDKGYRQSPLVDTVLRYQYCVHHKTRPNGAFQWFVPFPYRNWYHQS
mgnify:CR=1 FL=1